MKQSLSENMEDKPEGFTLVEVAISLIVIGLLVGGVLKGQELIKNSQINATISQFKNIKAGVMTFRDTYQSFPGDMNRATARVPNCGACFNGSANAIVDVAVNWVTAAGGGADEATAFWQHLNAADLVGGVSGQFVAGGGQWGEILPAAPLGGGFTVGYTDTGRIFQAIGPRIRRGAGSQSVKPGHYLTLKNNTLLPALSRTDNTTHIDTSTAMNLDEKIDDGAPNTGAVVALGNTACATTRTPAGQYNAAYLDPNCAIAILLD